MTAILATAAFTLPDGAGSGGPAWWQTIGGLLAVFGLLILCLRLLGRFNRRGGFGHASLVAVWHLGPRREIQVLRLADDVHYVYRHEGAMVLLKQESWAEWQRSRPAEEARTKAPGVGGLRRWLPLSSLPGGLKVPGGSQGR